MGLSRRKFTKEMKVTAIRQLEAGTSAAEVARAFEVNPNLLHRWRKEFRHGPGNAFPGVGKRRWEDPKVAQLERKVGQQAVEIDFLKRCLQRLEEQRIVQALTGKPRSAARSKARSKKAAK
jgi:transposase-like protein